MKNRLFLINICEESKYLNFNSRINSYTNYNGALILNYCFFSRLTTFNGNGGNLEDINGNSGSIIFIKDVNCNLSINNCIFYNCSSTGSSGAIYFYSLTINSGILLNKVCSFECWVTSISGDGNFASLSTLNNNIYNYLSIIESSNKGNGDSPIKIEYGNQIINNINSSNNYCEYASSIWSRYSLSFFLELLYN